MDLNRLLSEHQVALHDLAAGASPEGRRWAGLRADYYAEEIRKTRTVFGRFAAMTFPGHGEGVCAHG